MINILNTRSIVSLIFAATVFTAGRVALASDSLYNNEDHAVAASAVFGGTEGSASIVEGSLGAYVTGNNITGQLGLPEKARVAAMKKIDDFSKYVSKVILRKDFILILTKSGQLYAAGKNVWGQFGIGSYQSFNKLKKISDDLKDVAAGEDFIAILKNNGSLMTAGKNDKGQLGIGSQKDSNIFMEIKSPEDRITGISAAGKSLLITDKSNGLWATGDNSYGQLGMGSIVTIAIPLLIEKNVRTAAISEKFSFIVKLDGRILASGDNTYGQLGLGDTTSRKLYETLNLNTSVRKIVLGRGHSLILTDEGNILAAGNNTLGQLGVKHSVLIQQSFQNSASNVLDVAATQNGTIYISRSDSHVYATGYNKNGELGLGCKYTFFDFTPLQYTNYVC